MKKIFILTIALCTLCSCAITTSITSCYGNITTFTPQGDTLKVWKNVLIQETVTNGYGANTNNAFKNFGLNFTDSTGRNIIIGNAIPYIIDYDTIHIEYDYYEEYTNDS